MKKIYFIIIALLACIYIILEVRKGKFSIKESFWWVMASFVMLFLAIFPYIFDFLAKIFNVSYGPSLLFVFCIIFLVFINFRSSKKIAELQLKVTELSQHIAILEEQENEKK